MNDKSKKILIVGAGIGGVATALRLAKQGYQVEIVEKNSQAGGRLNQIRKDGFTFDTGPSFFSMSYEFEEFAKDCGIRLPFEYQALDPLYTVHLKGHSKPFYLYRDPEKLAVQFAAIESDFLPKFDRYIRRAEQLFRDTVDVVIKKNFDSKWDYFTALSQVNPSHLPVLTRSFWKEVCRHFSSREARQIISLVAFFLGRTPFDTMAVYTLLSYTEFKHDGYYNVSGGMYRIIEGLLKELRQENVRMTYNTEIVRHKTIDRRLIALVDQNGGEWSADAYVINADAAAFRGKIFGRRDYSEARLDKKQWTMGYLTIYLGIRGKLPQIDHHNYFLGSNFEEYAHDIMRDPGILDKPYYYVNVLSKHNPDCAPPDCESLFFVCPVPNLLFKSDWGDRDLIVDSILEDFSRRVGKDIRPDIVTKTVYTPRDWQERFNLYRGGGLGLAHSMWQIGAFRPPNFDEVFDNVFYVGASTTPGAGIPMSIIGSKLVVERLTKKFNDKP